MWSPHQRELILAAEADQTIHARAFPKSVQLAETYSYERVIARNHATEASGKPTGRLKIVVPYDGERYFSCQAHKDVRRQVKRITKPAGDALIGHLAVINSNRTDLAGRLDLSHSFGSIPLRVPITHRATEDLDWLLTDQYSCVIEYAYTAQQPAVIPIEVRMDLLDSASSVPSKQSLKDLVGQVAGFESFHPDLVLSMRVAARLPGWAKPSSPRIRRMSLDWPTMTSLRGLRLKIDGQPHDLAYDPATRSLRWADVPLGPVTEESTGSELRTYSSPEMQLLIHEPGELYEQGSLTGRVEVELPGCLLSGLRARLFDATGRRSTKPDLKVVSRLVAAVRLVLDDAFANRVLTPYALLHFDEVIPDLMRLADIRAALSDRGFRIEHEMQDLPGTRADALSYFLLASHAKGPNEMQLWLLVEGKRYSTRRETQIPGGLTYTSTFESGELKIHMGGVLPGDSEGVIHEMNALQMALRDRFERLRAKR